MVDDWYYIVRSRAGQGSARTPGGAEALAMRWDAMKLGPCTIERTSPTLERAGRNIAFALGLAALWHLVSQERGEHWLEDSLREAGQLQRQP